ncbi:hypothetical protein [Marinobacter sp. BGYM27]|nr:hypothetical protein [Marinobacter sp. BGYM27]MDG5498350.1 hypothetical protein [Marinobacter sp. BGYM27]|tara:strand:- start:518 stop:667 length:150 start_codon:yes stop_codon:yes gene_type:complete
MSQPARYASVKEDREVEPRDAEILEGAKLAGMALAIALVIGLVSAAGSI